MCFYTYRLKHILLYIFVWYKHTQSTQHKRNNNNFAKKPKTNTHDSVFCVCVCVMSNQGFTARPVNVIYGHDNSIWHCADYNECEWIANDDARKAGRNQKEFRLKGSYLYYLWVFFMFRLCYLRRKTLDEVYYLRPKSISVGSTVFFFVYCLIECTNTSPYKCLISLSIKKRGRIH